MITRLWRFLFDGCEHDWQPLRDGQIAAVQGNIHIGPHYEQKCSKCQRIRYFNTWVF